MTPPRFQFTIRNLLWATFWVALAAAAFCYPQSMGGVGLKVSRYNMMALRMFNLAPLFAVCCAFAAVGAIVGKHKLGLLAGACLWVGWFLWIVAFHESAIWHFAK